MESALSAQFYEVLVLNIPMSSTLTSITHFLNDLTPGEVHSSRFVLLKHPHHGERLLFNQPSQKGCSSAGILACAIQLVLCHSFPLSCPFSSCQLEQLGWSVHDRLSPDTSPRWRCPGRRARCRLHGLWLHRTESSQ